MSATDQYIVLLGHCTASPRAYRIFSIDDDPNEALAEARRMKDGIRLSHAYNHEGLTLEGWVVNDWR